MLLSIIYNKVGKDSVFFQEKIIVLRDRIGFADADMNSGTGAGKEKKIL